MAKNFNWERAKYKPRPVASDKEIEAQLHARARAAAEEPVFLKVENPKFKFTHAIHDIGKGTKLYKVYGDVLSRTDIAGKVHEYVRLLDPERGLPTKPIATILVRGANVVSTGLP